MTPPPLTNDITNLTPQTAWGYRANIILMLPRLSALNSS